MHSKIIEVNYGILSIAPRINCTIITGKDIIHQATGIQNDLFFGKIDYNCSDKSFGSLISEEKCAECSLFCDYNELFPHCSNRQYLFPFCLGLLLILYAFAFLTAIVFKYKKRILKYIDRLAYYHNFLKQCKADEKEINTIKKLQRTLKQNIPVQLINQYELDTYHREKINVYRSKLLRDVRNWSSPINLLRNGTSALLTASVLASQMQSSGACDSSIYFKSTNAFCIINEGKCTDISVVSFHLQHGKKLCFTEENGDVFKIHISEMGKYVSYMPVYDTTEYRINTNTKVYCKGTDKCWDGECQSSSKNLYLKNETIETNNLFKYGCGTTPLTCPGTNCFFGSSCVYYVMWLETYGPRATVYKRSREGWYVNIQFEYKNITENVLINARQPTYNLNDFRKLKQEISFDFSEPTFEHEVSSNMLLKDQELFYAVDASPLDHPSKELIGDFQINLNEEDNSLTSKFPLFDIKCQVGSCNVNCPSPIPQLELFREKVKANAIQSMHASEVHTDNIVLQVPAIGSVPMSLGNVNVKNAKITQGRCIIDVVEQYSCYGCNRRPFVKVQASEILSEGIMSFLSNCSFSRPYFSCSEGDFLMEYNQFDEYCKVEIPIINSTFVIINKNKFEGRVFFKHERSSSSITSKISSGYVLNSPNFQFPLKMGAYALGASITIGPIFTLVYKLIILCIANRNMVHTNERLA